MQGVDEIGDSRLADLDQSVGGEAGEEGTRIGEDGDQRRSGLGGAPFAEAGNRAGAHLGAGIVEERCEEINRPRRIDQRQRPRRPPACVVVALVGAPFRRGFQRDDFSQARQRLIAMRGQSQRRGFGAKIVAARQFGEESVKGVGHGDETRPGEGARRAVK